MDLITPFIDLLLHSDVALRGWVIAWGAWIYPLLFLVIFMETGAVVTPFLPGDSLLFTGGAIAAVAGSALDARLLAAVLVTAAVLGDAVNYSVGRGWGRRILGGGRFSRAIKPDHITQTEAFFARHSGKTVLLARFFPFVRTFAPFVAGISRMDRRKFALDNVAGAVAWVSLFVVAGYLFGNIPLVAHNLEYLVIGIVILSLAPACWQLLRGRVPGRAA